MKNCGSPVFEEVATPEFMQILSALTTCSHDVRTQVLTCIQNWAFVFKDKPEYSAIQDAYEELKNKGYTFPEFSENDAMFSVVCAPNWKEESFCHRCKVAFTTFRRRHHCRNCGNSFCAECSSERTVLPQFGIEKEVRVCDHCFEQLTRHPNQEKPAKEKKPQPNRDEQARRDQERKERELEARENEELELALALSASEAESKERERRALQRAPQKTTEPPVDTIGPAENGPLKLLPVLDTSDMDPELARYLNRHYWENRAASSNQLTNKSALDDPHTSPGPQPSAPIYSSPIPTPVKTGNPSGLGVVQTNGLLQSGNDNNTVFESKSTFPGVPELTTPKQEEFLNALRASVEFFVNRMQSNSQRGRSIANDTTVQALFLTLHEMHPQLLQYKQAMEERRAYFEGLQDKITQLRDAREALDALRQEHAARRQLEEQEAARLRQLQMMQKLEVMRQQKRDTLEYRRRLAMEQTMQYQQQYQLPPQSMQHSMDPVTGMPITMPIGPYPGGYQIPNPSYSVAGPTQGMYIPPSAYGSGQGVMSNMPQYYPGQPQSHPQQSNPFYGVPTTNQPQIHPGAYPSHPPGPYSMQQMEASLPAPQAGTDPSSMYPSTAAAHTPGQHPSANTIAAEDPSTVQPPSYSQLPDRPAEDSQPATSTGNYPSTGYSQPQAALLEGQLISFD